MSKKIILLLLIVLGGWHNLRSQEICDNGLDDDGDGLIDCFDPDCTSDISCPAFQHPGSCLPAGYYPDIIGTADGFRANGSNDVTSIPKAIGSLRKASLTIQGTYQSFLGSTGTGNVDLNFADDRVIYGVVDFDFEANTSSGFVEYLQNNYDSKRYAWVDQPIGPNRTDTYIRKGHDLNEVPNFEFVFDQTATELLIRCDEQTIDLSYYVIYYGNFDSQSMTNVSGPDPTQYPSYFAAGNVGNSVSQTIDLPAGTNTPNFVRIRSLGANQNRIGTNNVLILDSREEGIARKDIVIDMSTLTASGIITVSNGPMDNVASTYTFRDYDITTGVSVLNGATILGETNGNTTGPQQIGLSDPTIQIAGNQLIITRSTPFATDFNEIFYLEFYQYTNQPFSSSFFITNNIYSSPYDIGFDPGIHNDGVFVAGYVDFIIPVGAKRAFLQITGNGLHKSLNYVGPTSNAEWMNNENQMIAFIEVDLENQKTSGYYSFLATSSSQQLYAWQSVPINPAIDFTTTSIYGQSPNTDDRINFEMIDGKLRIHLRNDKWAFERLLQMTFLGAKVNLVSPELKHLPSTEVRCDSVFFDVEICNSGASNLIDTIPVAFYLEDPTVDVNASLFDVQMLPINIEVGKCTIYQMGIEASSFELDTDYKISTVINDNGSLAKGIGIPIGNVIDFKELENNDSLLFECEFDENVSVTNFDIPSTHPTLSFEKDSFLICSKDTASIKSIVTDALEPIQYLWETGETIDEYQANFVPNSKEWISLKVGSECSNDTIIDSVYVETHTITQLSLSIDSIEVCDGDNTTISSTLTGGLEPYQYSWNSGESLNQIDVSPSANTGNWYYLTSTDACENIQLDSAFVQVHSLPELELPIDSFLVCPREGVMITSITTGGFAPYAYEWNTFETADSLFALGNPGSKIWHQLTVTDACGKKASDSSFVEVQTLPELTLNKSLFELCAGDTAFLKGIVVKGVEPYVYEWNNGILTDSNFVIAMAGDSIYSVLKVTDACGNMVSDSALIKADTLPSNIIIPDSLLLCVGDNVRIIPNVEGGREPIQYNWSSGETIPIISVTITENLSSWYSLIVQDACAIERQDSVFIEAIELPEVTILEDSLLLCPTDSIQLHSSIIGGKLPLSYSWQNGSIKDSSLYIAIASSSEWVSLQVIDACSINSEDSVWIEVSDYPSLSLNQSNFELCIGDTAKISTISSGGIEPYTYLWNDGSTTNLNEVIPTAGDSIYSIVTLTDACQNRVSDSALVKVDTLPSNIIRPDSLLLCSGESIEIIPTISGGRNPIQYSWSNFSTDPTILVSVQENLKEWFSLTITDACGQIRNDSVFIEAYELPVISIVEDSVKLCPGDSLIVSSTLLGGKESYIYSWSNGSILESSLYVAIPADKIWLQVTVTDDCSKETSDSIYIEVSSLPVLSLNQRLFELCEGDTAKVQSTVVGGELPIDFTWQDRSILNSFSVSPTANDSVIAIVQITDQCGIERIDSAKIKVATLPTVSIVPDTLTVCLGSTTLIEAISDPSFTYSWSLGSMIQSMDYQAVIPVPQWIAVTVEDKCLKQATDSVLIKTESLPEITLSEDSLLLCPNEDALITSTIIGGKEDFSFIWNDGNTDQSRTIQQAPSLENWFTLEVTDACNQSAIDSVFIKTYSLPIIQIDETRITLCPQDTATVTGKAYSGSLPYSYSWENGEITAIAKIFPSPGEINWHTLTLVDACLNTSSDSILIEKNLPPFLSLSEDSIRICPSGNANVTSLLENGTLPINYNWSHGSNDINLEVSPTEDTWYNLSILDGCGFERKDSVFVEIVIIPKIAFDATDTIGCPELPVSFTSDVVLENANFEWMLGNGIVSSETAPSTVYKEEGCYDVHLKITSPEGCIASEVKRSYICVYPKSIADFNYSPKELNLYDTEISFENYSINSNQYEWIINDTGFISTEEPTVKFSDETPGSYDICLIATSEYNCTDTTCQVVIINGVSSIYIPNSFSPNGDLLNDIFIPKYSQLNEDGYEFTIFNRWGEIIFTSTIPSLGWDGTHNGEKVKIDTYVYLVKGKLIYSNEDFTKRGKVTLLR